MIEDSGNGGKLLHNLISKPSTKAQSKHMSIHTPGIPAHMRTPAHTHTYTQLTGLIQSVLSMVENLRLQREVSVNITV